MFYHWLGIEAEPTMDDLMETAWREMNRCAHSDFMELSQQAFAAANLIEGDGWITQWPKL